MGPTFSLLFAIFFLFSNADAASCIDGWVAYKDELCIKIFEDFVSYDDAKAYCSTHGTDNIKSSLVMVKGPDMQTFLANYTQTAYDNVWLGGRYDNDTAQFKWDDGEQLTFSNWQDGYPRNVTDATSCIELRPSNAKAAVNSDGEWANVLCQKRNLVMCQRTLTWTLDDAISEIIRVRKQLQTTQEDLQAVKSSVVPIGTIYVEYADQHAPPALWPNLTWEDITSTFAGVFFRALGRGSGSWKEEQAACIPSITRMQYATQAMSFPDTVDISTVTSGWTPFGGVGRYYSTTSGSEGLRFHKEWCEVRPKNQAIRIWKRTA